MIIIRKIHVGDNHKNKEEKQEEFRINNEKKKLDEKNYRKNHYDDLKKYRKEYMRRYLQELKAWAVNKLGRKCHDCGLITQYDCIYDFHHLGEDSWKGDMNLKTKILREWQLNGEIPNDVLLLCSNCHRVRSII